MKQKVGVLSMFFLRMKTKTFHNPWPSVPRRFSMTLEFRLLHWRKNICLDCFNYNFQETTNAL